MGIEKYRQRVKSLGVEFREGRNRIEDEGNSLYFYDYDNHLFELHTGTLEQRLARYSTSRCYEVQESHPQPPPISKVYPFLPPAAGGLRGVRGGGLRCTS